MIALLVLFIAAAAGLGFFALRGKSDVHDRIAALDAAAGLSRDDNTTFVSRFMDEQRKNALANRLLEAGWTGVTPAMLYFRMVAGAAGGCIAGLVVMVLMHGKPGSIFLTVVLTAFMAYRPFSGLNGAIEKRKKAIHRSLPDFLDALTTCVDAGVALNGALITATSSLEGPLADEMQSALQDIRLGRSRADALQAMAQRVRDADLTTTVTALVQSERLGSSVTDVLSQLAVEARERRFLRAEEAAAQLPNKLVIPIGLCMLPSLMLLIFGSVIANLLR